MSKKALMAIVLVAGFLGATMAFAADEADYVGNTQCKMCHNKKEEGEIWTVWSTKSHAKAFEVLKSPEAKAAGEKAGLDKPPYESPKCLACHVTGYKAENTPPVPAKLKQEDGVQCESCHGPASLHIKDGQARKMKKDMTVDTSAHIIRPDEKTCVKCHNDQNPTWNPERYTLEDGKKVGFDFKQAWKKIEHHIPKEGK